MNQQIKHVDAHLLSRDSSTWMAVLLHSLHFRLVDLRPSNAPSRRPVYVLDSDLHYPVTPTSGSGFRRETGSGRSANNLSDLLPSPSSSSTSLRTVSYSSQRTNRRRISCVGSTGTAPPTTTATGSGGLESPPLASRRPLRERFEDIRP